MSVIVLCSGGPDSLQAALEVQHKLSRLLFIDWGQPAVSQELQAAQRCAHLLAVPLNVRAMSAALFKPLEAPGQPGPRVVAGRNLLFIAAAVDSAVEHNCNTIVLGATKDDYDDYPDCRPEFFEKVDLLCKEAYGVGVMAPLLQWSKERVLRALGSWSVHTWSCYEPINSLPCGTCNACLARAACILKTAT